MNSIMQKSKLYFLVFLTLAVGCILAGTVTIQGNGNIIDDARIVSNAPGFNGGGDVWGNVTYFTSNNNSERTYLRIPVPVFITPQYADSITNASLKLYFSGLETGPFDISVHEVISDWSEFSIRWITKPNHDPIPLDTFTLVQQNVWAHFTITELLKEWISGEKPNHGVTLKSLLEAPPIQDLSVLWTSDYSDPTLRPILEITSSQLPDTIVNNYMVAIKDGQKYIEGSLNYRLYQNFPNPFNPKTKIQFSIFKRSIIRLSVLDVHGRVLEVLLVEEKLPGTYNVDFDGKDLSTGIYFYRLNVSGEISTKKFILIK